MSRILRLPAFALLVLAACSEPPSGGSIRAGVPGNGSNGLDTSVVAHGAGVYRQHCASCHGERGQGAFAWHKPGADGKYPPPPLDGSAHAWHHPYAWLQDTIRNGTVNRGGGMPGWSGTLTGTDIDAVIAYFQSLWPEEIYRAWQDIDRRAREAAR